MKIGVLALQGAFADHRKMLETLGIESFDIRKNLKFLLYVEQKIWEKLLEE